MGRLLCCAFAEDSIDEEVLYGERVVTPRSPDETVYRQEWDHSPALPPPTVVDRIQAGRERGVEARKHALSVKDSVNKCVPCCRRGCPVALFACCNTATDDLLPVCVVVVTPRVTSQVSTAGSRASGLALA